jgi:hypothetical protein
VLRCERISYYRQAFLDCSLAVLYIRTTFRFRIGPL